MVLAVVSSGGFESRQGVELIHVLSLQLRGDSGGIRLFTQLRMPFQGWFIGRFIAFIAWSW